MNTPTHLLMTAAIRKAKPSWKIVKSAALWGSVAPDLPLYFLTFGGLFYFTKVKGWTFSDAAHRIFDTLYFEDPAWIGLHNFLHSPLNLALLILLNQLLSKKLPRLTNWMRWFLLACALHSLVDIVTHHDDGPLLFWPLNWTVRFNSPVSYWDHRYYGHIFMPFEFTLCLILIGYLVGPWLVRKLQTKFGRRTQ